MPRRLLMLTPVPEEGAGARFRLYQFIPWLEAEDYHVTVEPFLTAEFFQIIYQHGRYLQKARCVVQQTLRRLQLVIEQAQYDLFMVYREAFPVGPPVIERWLIRTGRPFIYDFDDAVFLPNQSEANRLLGMLKCPQKVAQIIRASTHVIAGNPMLVEYARRFHQHVSFIPTCVDTTRFVPRPARPSDARWGRPVVGWIGSHSTVKYLRSLLPILTHAARVSPFTLYVVGSPARLEADGLTVEQVPWTLAQEVANFQRCDIGVYPLWDDAWGQGKSGFKAIQFMACGIPVVAASVGITRDIIHDGVNGFLATTPDEWVQKLGWLLTDPALRRRLGAAGRETVEQRYSLAANAPVLLSTLCDALNRGSGSPIASAGSASGVWSEALDGAGARAVMRSSPGGTKRQYS